MKARSFSGLSWMLRRDQVCGKCKASPPSSTDSWCNLCRALEVLTALARRKGVTPAHRILAEDLVLATSRQVEALFDLDRKGQSQIESLTQKLQGRSQGSRPAVSPRTAERSTTPKLAARPQANRSTPTTPVKKEVSEKDSEEGSESGQKEEPEAPPRSERRRSPVREEQPSETAAPAATRRHRSRSRHRGRRGGSKHQQIFRTLTNPDLQLHRRASRTDHIVPEQTGREEIRRRYGSWRECCSWSSTGGARCTSPRWSELYGLRLEHPFPPFLEWETFEPGMHCGGRLSSGWCFGRRCWRSDGTDGKIMDQGRGRYMGRSQDPWSPSRLGLARGSPVLFKEEDESALLQFAGRPLPASLRAGFPHHRLPCLRTWDSAFRLLCGPQEKEGLGGGYGRIWHRSGRRGHLPSRAARWRWGGERTRGGRSGTGFGKGKDWLPSNEAFRTAAALSQHHSTRAYRNFSGAGWSKSGFRQRGKGSPAEGEQNSGGGNIRRRREDQKEDGIREATGEVRGVSFEGSHQQEVTASGGAEVRREAEEEKEEGQSQGTIAEQEKEKEEEVDYKQYDLWLQQQFIHRAPHASSSTACDKEAGFGFGAAVGTRGGELSSDGAGGPRRGDDRSGFLEQQDHDVLSNNGSPPDSSENERSSGTRNAGQRNRLFTSRQGRAARRPSFRPLYSAGKRRADRKLADGSMARGCSGSSSRLGADLPPLGDPETREDRRPGLRERFMATTKRRSVVKLWQVASRRSNRKDKRKRREEQEQRQEGQEVVLEREAASGGQRRRRKLRKLARDHSVRAPSVLAAPEDEVANSDPYLFEEMRDFNEVFLGAGARLKAAESPRECENLHEEALDDRRVKVDPYLVDALDEEDVFAGAAALESGVRLNLEAEIETMLLPFLGSQLWWEGSSGTGPLGSFLSAELFASSDAFEAKANSVKKRRWSLFPLPVDTEALFFRDYSAKLEGSASTSLDQPSLSWTEPYGWRKRAFSESTGFGAGQTCGWFYFRKSWEVFWGFWWGCWETRDRVAVARVVI